MAAAKISDMLAELNTHRSDRGLPPLKSWKESRVKLQGAIDKFNGINLEEGIDKVFKTKKEREKMKKLAETSPKGVAVALHNAELQQKYQKEHMPKTKRIGDELDPGNLVSICEELGMTTKRARARLRGSTFAKKGKLWRFAGADVKKVKEFLTKK
jgi:hypothetical protein